MGTLCLNRVINQISQAQALILDFDGTLVDSNPIKLKAFDLCFEKYGDRMDEIRDWQKISVMEG